MSKIDDEQSQRLHVELVSKASDPLLQALYQRLDRNGKGPANIHRTLANSPHIFSRFIDYAHGLRSDADIAPADRELIILRVLERARGEYELSHHRIMAREVGLSDAMIRAVALPDYKGEGVFDDHQVLLLRFADDYVDGRGLTPEITDQLRHTFTDRQLIDIGLTMALYFGLAHLSSVIDIPLD